ncbi:MAG TPA: crotonase/enoyl-CoA hydratase family protein [Rhodoferax sp.]|jgi:enoyl-CoA hydratase/carnithine racemase|nr:crotonase/enoyl-CoA hydratase family protein [Rhodoferax sp.]HQY76057.1 crotonase/enoyl-CoA hydratase family protein [Rhodoferax sp.]
MTYTTLTTQIDDGILTLTLNRPEQMNAFTVEMAHELVDVYRSASANDAVRAIVVTGAGKAFCAGMDLSRPGNVFGLNEDLQPTLQDMQERLDDPEVLQGVRDTGGLISLAVYDCTKPVIGAINGAAVGIGATMTLPMDVRLASDKARIGFVFGRIGIVPEACSSWFLPRIVGISQALEWAYCADILTPEEALQGRLIKAIVPHDQLLAEAHKLAHRMTDGRSPVGIALTRQMMYRNAAQPHPLEAHKVDSLAMFYTSVNDGKEGVRAFLEKRPAQFTSRTSTDMPGFYPWW